jgi:hypothetical protein
MSISRWKIMACSLGLSVGGLAFVAGQSHNQLNAQWEIKPEAKAGATAPVVLPPGPEHSSSLTSQILELEILAPQSPAPVPEPRGETGAKEAKEPVRISEIKIIGGGALSKDNVIRSQINLYPGQVLCGTDLIETQRALSRLGIFEDATVEVENPQVAEPYKNILVRVKEKSAVSEVDTLPMPRPATAEPAAAVLTPDFAVSYPLPVIAVVPPVAQVPAAPPPPALAQAFQAPAPAEVQELVVPEPVHAPQTTSAPQPAQTVPVTQPIATAPLTPQPVPSASPIVATVPLTPQPAPVVPVMPPMVQPAPAAPPAIVEHKTVSVPAAPMPTPVPAALPANVAPTMSAPACPVQQASGSSVCKLKMLVRLGDGRPRFEIRTSDSADLLFKVYAEKVDMQPAPEGAKTNPIAGVTAVGQVRFVGPGVEGTCDQLCVLSGTGEVLLKGNVSMKTKRGKTWSEMTAEKMIYQIGASGLSTTANSGAIRPASHTTTK